ncbi:MAG: trypsin-like peptidase domain-containing protein [Betaproteobacteria bacterium]|nr:trypsin-like peptidase domain-containing protein [Betaproteobacteria bacterium]
MKVLPVRGAAKAAWLILCLAQPLAVFGATSAQGASRAQIEAVSNSTFEVVVLKPTHDSLTYERPLPLDQIPYAIRNDLYYSVGTAFAIAGKRWVTAAHVLGLGRASMQKTYRLRDRKGKVYDIDQIYKFSLRRDFVVFSIKDNPAVRPLPTHTTPRLNDRVFAVGNALGQGIVYRDGLFTSQTPEERDGKWRWIRFSAAASPGNSGGPLLDTRGRVIGVVVRKSENENLNYALPIREVLDAKGRVAEINTEIMYMIDNMANLTHRERLATEIPLPKSYAELDAELIPIFNRFGQQLKDTLFKNQAARIFPNGATSAALLHSTYNAVVPGILGIGKDGNWDAFFNSKTQTGDLGANGHFTYGTFFGTQVFLLRTPDAVKLETLRSDSKLMMDLMLRGDPLYRSIGAEQIRIVSMGKAAQENTHLDAYGRKWLVRIWDIEENDQRVALFALPVPGGFVGMLRRMPTGLAEGHLVDLRAFADFFYVSYYGTLAQWREWLALRDLLPAAFADIRIDFDYGQRFEYASKRLSFSYGAKEMSITPHSDLKLQFSYFQDNGRTVWDVTQVIAGDDKDNSTLFSVARNIHPAARLDDKFRVRWEKIAKRKPPYDKSAFAEDKRMLVADVIAGPLGADRLAQAPLLYTALYAFEGKAEQKSVEAKLDVFIDKLKVNEY